MMTGSYPIELQMAAPHFYDKKRWIKLSMKNNSAK